MKLYNYVLLKYQNASKFKFINHLQYVKYTFEVLYKVTLNKD